MTYGAAVPRFKPRPTLDNLREPKVPLSSPNRPTSRNQSQYNSHPSYTTPQPPTPSNAHSSRSSTSGDQTSRRDPSRQVKPSTSKPDRNNTDIFGYTSTSADSREPSIYRDEEFEEDGSVALTEQAGSVSSQRTARNSKSETVPSANDKKGKPPGKSKGRLHLSLGFGRSKQQQPAEPARLRDITEIRIQNPTFTRENISARNYDAFFESGEPVYSLEYRTPITPQTNGASSDDKRPNSFGFFSKMSKSSAKSNARSHSSDPMSTVSEKGDRCHSLQ